MTTGVRGSRPAEAKKGLPNKSGSFPPIEKPTLPIKLIGCILSSSLEWLCYIGTQLLALLHQNKREESP